MSDEIRCPKCHSNQIAAGQQGFGIGKAAVGLVALGPLGLAGGFINKNKVELLCMSCGNRWKPTPVKPPPPTTEDNKTAALVLLVIVIIIAVIVGIGALIEYCPLCFLILIIIGIVLFSISWLMEEKKRIQKEAKNQCNDGN
jgi:tellurium resistance protein TerD